jgi:hypothetical protein
VRNLSFRMLLKYLKSRPQTLPLPSSLSLASIYSLAGVMGSAEAPEESGGQASLLYRQLQPPSS